MANGWSRKLYYVICVLDTPGCPSEMWSISMLEPQHLPALSLHPSGSTLCNNYSYWVQSNIIIIAKFVLQAINKPIGSHSTTDFAFTSH